MLFKYYLIPVVSCILREAMRSEMSRESLIACIVKYCSVRIILSYRVVVLSECLVSWQR